VPLAILRTSCLGGRICFGHDWRVIYAAGARSHDLSVENRIEHDMLGTREVPAHALYGVHTLRAAENFPYGHPLLREVPEFSRAFVMVKRAAARANTDCDVLDLGIGQAIVAACDELLEDPRRLFANLPLPVLQGGAGTSTNMNVNEVIANCALQRLGYEVGAYEHLHPNDHVNRSQSTNDVYPTALRVALVLRNRPVEVAVDGLARVLAAASDEHRGAAKLGRTQLRDAVPMRVGEEFDAWAEGCRQSSVALRGAIELGLLEVNLGGTAIGTSLGAPPGYAQLAVRYLSEESGVPLQPAKRPVSATTDPSGLLGYSAALRSSAVRLAKLANDLRLLSSGPHTGLSELQLPAVQAGSSMMPGKVNPVIPEYVNQLCFRIHGLDLTTTLALDAAQLQLGAMLPAAAASLFEAQDCLRVACEGLTDRCVRGITIDEERMSRYATAGLGELTEAVSVLGYEESSRRALEAEQASIPVTDLTDLL
jgi:aspartate ammonia-lyase